MEYVGDILYDDILLQNRKYIIYGTGEYGKRIYEYLKGIHKEGDILFFCDKNKYNSKLFDVDIIKPEKAIGFKNADFLVAGRYEREMVSFLVKNGINRIHILSFDNF